MGRQSFGCHCVCYAGRGLRSKGKRKRTMAGVLKLKGAIGGFLLRSTPLGLALMELQKA